MQRQEETCSHLPFCSVADIGYRTVNTRANVNSPKRADYRYSRIIDRAVINNVHADFLKSEQSRFSRAEGEGSRTAVGEWLLAVTQTTVNYRLRG